MVQMSKALVIIWQRGEHYIRWMDSTVSSPFSKNIDGLYYVPFLEHIS